MDNPVGSQLVRTLSVTALCLALLAVLAGPAAAWGDKKPPTVPTGVQITDLTFNHVTVAWNASTDNSGWVRYQIELEGPQTQLVYSMTTSTTLSVTVGGSYTVSVRAHDGALNYSAWTTPIPVEFPVDTEAPTTPGNLRATFDAGGAVDQILWDPSTDNSGWLRYELWSAEAGFLVYVKNSAGIDAWKLTDFYCVVFEGETHTLTVRAHDYVHNYSAWSNSLTVTF